MHQIRMGGKWLDKWISGWVDGWMRRGAQTHSSILVELDPVLKLILPRSSETIIAPSPPFQYPLRARNTVEYPTATNDKGTLRSK